MEARRKRVKVLYKNEVAGHLECGEGVFSFAYDVKYLRKVKPTEIHTTLPLRYSKYKKTMLFEAFQSYLPQKGIEIKQDLEQAVYLDKLVSNPKEKYSVLAFEVE